MSFRSIIQDMKEEIGCLSRKGFEVKLGYGLRSGSHRALRDGLRPSPIAGLKQSRWANLPPELLRDVLMRIEEAEGLWPHRKDVVSCAEMCRSWREIMKEIAKTPEVSGKLTFPISVKQAVTAMKPGGLAPTQTDFPRNNIDSFSSIPFFRFKSSRMDSFSALSNSQNEVKLILKNKGSKVA